MVNNLIIAFTAGVTVCWQKDVIRISKTPTSVWTMKILLLLIAETQLNISISFWFCIRSSIMSSTRNAPVRPTPALDQIFTINIKFITLWTYQASQTFKSLRTTTQRANIWKLFLFLAMEEKIIKQYNRNIRAMNNYWSIISSFIRLHFPSEIE